MLRLSRTGLTSIFSICRSIPFVGCTSPNRVISCVAMGSAGGGFCYEYPRPAVTVDAVVFTVKREHACVLLIERGRPPYEGKFALPGGFVNENESLDVAVHRELQEETNLTGLTLCQIAAFGDPGRDPRGHTISVAFHGVIEEDGGIAQKLCAGDDAACVSWHPLDALPELAFDHMSIIQSSWSKCVFMASPHNGVVVIDKATNTELNNFSDGVVDGIALSNLVLSIKKLTH
eukprot:254518_1